MNRETNIVTDAAAHQTAKREEILLHATCWSSGISEISTEERPKTACSRAAVAFASRHLYERNRARTTHYVNKLISKKINK